MTSSTGLGETSAQSAIQNFIDGGVTIHLLDTALGYTDTSTEITNNSVVSQTVAQADLTINTPTSFSGVATLENDNDIVYDVSAETATIVEVVIQSQNSVEEWALADETNDPDLSNLDEYRIDATTILYELGNP
jgi:predicted ATP-binding protein involved in virulence